jgi:DHA1 family multidrug resistance protein-like MFS transporter
MASRFHSTIFGQLVRALSGNKYFRYPDEIDPSLWKKAVQSPSPEEEKGEENNDNNDPTMKEAGAGAGAQDLASTNHIVDDGKDILVVGWYGQDDLEVRTLVCASCSLPI